MIDSGLLARRRIPASAEALDGLVNVCLPFAHQALQRHGEFYPFGAAVGMDGQSRMLGADRGVRDRPASQNVLDTLLDAVRLDRDQLKAVAMCSDVRVSNGDAVRVELEHREGQSIAVLLPYKRRRFGRGVEFQPLQAGAATRRIWT